MDLPPESSSFEPLQGTIHTGPSSGLLYPAQGWGIRRKFRLSFKLVKNLTLPPSCTHTQGFYSGVAMFIGLFQVENRLQEVQVRGMFPVPFNSHLFRHAEGVAEADS